MLSSTDVLTTEPFNKDYADAVPQEVTVCVAKQVFPLLLYKVDYSYLSNYPILSYIISAESKLL